jgi:hypothetical protein
MRRIYQLALAEPDLFECWTRVPVNEREEHTRVFKPEDYEFKNAENREIKQGLIQIAKEFGVVHLYSTPSVGSKSLELKWCGPVEGLKDFVEAARKYLPPYDRITVWGWYRMRSSYHEEEIAKWYERVGLDRLGTNEERDPRISRLRALGLADNFAGMDWHIDWRCYNGVTAGFDEHRNCTDRHAKEIAYSWRGPDGQQVAGVEGMIDDYHTRLEIAFSNGDTLSAEIRFAYSANDPNAFAYVSISGEPISVTEHRWSELVDSTNSLIEPALLLYQNWLAIKKSQS